MDKEFAKKLGSQLESETLDGRPEGRRLRVFLDDWDIDPGENIVTRINRALEQARFVALLMSPEFFARDWPTVEWTGTLMDDLGRSRFRLIPLLVRTNALEGDGRIAIPPLLSPIKRVDFHEPRRFKTSVLKLVRRVRGDPQPRGARRRPLAMIDGASSPTVLLEPLDSAQPDAVPDLLLSNLLPVDSLPATIWSAQARLRRKDRDVQQSVALPPYEPHGGRIYTFMDLASKAEELAPVIEQGTVRSEPLSVLQQDRVTWNLVTSLMNWCLRKHLPNYIRRDSKGRYFFLPEDDGSNRVVRIGRGRGRTVAAKKTRKDGSVFWVHQGARLGFQTLGDQVLLRIDPCYVFTGDGQTPLGGKQVTRLAVKWTGKERNASVLRHVIFWSIVLQSGKSAIAINTGGAPIRVASISAATKLPFGIEGDHVKFRLLVETDADELDEVARSIDDDEGEVQE